MKYVISDIHGDEARFHDILQKINLQDDDNLYILGDVVDRGKDGIKILLEIMEMPNARMLLGNHEYMMLQALDESIDKWDRHYRITLWYNNGGMVTHKAFNNLPYDMQKKVIRFLKRLSPSLYVAAAGKRYMLVHAAPPKMFFTVPDYVSAKYESATEFAVWHRLKESDTLPKGYKYIHGHTPTSHETLFCDEMRIFYGKKRINIDCGCGYPCGYYGITGYLACLRLEDMKEFYSFPKTDD